MTEKNNEKKNDSKKKKKRQKSQKLESDPIIKVIMEQNIVYLYLNGEEHGQVIEEKNAVAH